MDTSQRQGLSPRQSSDDFSLGRSAVTQFDPGTTATAAGTLRGHDTQLQELRRENFNLKLRIFFLEENSSADPIEQSPRAALSTRYPSQHEFLNSAESPRGRSSSQDPSRSRVTPTRQSPQNTTEIETADDQHRPVNSVQTTEPDMSSHYSSSQIQLNDYKKREQKLLDERNTLERDLRSCENQAQRASRDWETRRREYEDEIKQLRTKEAKQERVVEQLKHTYDDRLARLEEERRKLVADQESYRHEPLLARIRFSYPLQDAGPSENVNVNIERYIQQIREQERTIQDLQAQIRSSNQNSSTASSDQRVRNLEKQVQKYQEDISHLQSECERLRRDELTLRQQISELSRVVDRLPPRPPQSPTTLTQLEPVQDPQKTVVQMSLNLRNDADNLATVNDRVQQLVRERDELQKRVRDVDALKHQFDQREDELRTRIEEQFKVQIEMLRKESDDSRDLVEALKVRIREMNEKLREEQVTYEENLHDLQRRHQQEKQTLQNEIDRRNERIDELEGRLTIALGETHDLEGQAGRLAAQRDEKIETLERQIEELRRQIAQLQQEHDELQNERADARGVQKQVQELLTERVQLRDELGQLKIQIEEDQHRIEQFHSELERQRRSNADLTDENDQLNQQNQTLEKQTRVLQTQVNEAEQLNRQFDGNLRQMEIDYRQAQLDLQEWRERFTTKENETNVLRGQNNAQQQALTDENDQLKKDLDDLEVRIRLQIDEKYHEEFERTLAEKQQEIDTLVEQWRNFKLQNDESRDRIDELQRQNERLRDQVERAYEDGQKEANKRHERIQQDNQRAFDEDLRRANDRNEQLKNELENLEVRIRLQVEEHYRDEYQHELTQRNQEIETLVQQNRQAHDEIQQLVDETQRREPVVVPVQRSDQTQRAVEEDLHRANERNEQLKNELENLEVRIRSQVEGHYRNEFQLQLTERNREVETLVQENRHAREEIQRLLDQIRERDRASARVQSPNQAQRAAEEELRRAKERVEQLANELKAKDAEIARLSSSPAGKPPSNYQRLNPSTLRPNETSGNDELIQQLRTEINARDLLIKKLQTDLSAIENEAANSQIKLRVRIEELEGDLGQRDNSFHLVDDEIRRKDEEIRELRENLTQTREEYLREIRQHDEIIQKQQSTIDDREDLLRQFEQRPDPQVYEAQLEALRDENERIQINLRIQIEEKEEQIHSLQNELQMSKAQEKNFSDDLRAELKQRIDEIEGLRFSNQKYEEELKRARQTSAKPANYVPRPQPPLPTQTNGAEPNRTIEALRQEVEVKDRRLKQLQDSNADLQGRVNDMAMKNGEHTQEINRLKQENRRLSDEIQRLRQQPRTDGTQTSSASHTTTLTIGQPPKGRREHELMTRDELLFELERAYDQIRRQNEILEAKSPNVTALHHQITDIRKELERQKYVNQVLWRKVNVCMDVHVNGAATRAELTHELANYQDELAKLKIQQGRLDDKRVSIPTVVSSSSDGSGDKADSGILSAQEVSEYQRQIDVKDDQIRHLNRQLTDTQSEVTKLTNLLRNQPPSPRQSTNGSSRDPHAEVQDLRHQLNEANGKSNRLTDENQKLRSQFEQLEQLLEHHKRQVELLERQLKTPSGSSPSTDDISIRRLDLAELLEEMRNLRRNLEISINKQNELQLKLDENLRQSRTPREFTFSGRGVSYPDLRLTEGSGSFNADNLSPLTIPHDQRSGPLGRSATDFESDENERAAAIRHRQYALTEIQTYDEIRRHVENVKFDLKALTPELRDRGRASRALEERLQTLDETLSQTLSFLERFWKSELPERNQFDEHPFIDVRLVDENKRLITAQRRYTQDLEHLRRKYKEQAALLDQVLVQLTSVQH